MAASIAGLSFLSAAAFGYDGWSKKELLEDISVLASTEFEGRLPGSRGEDRTVAFLEKRFKQLGLKPGNPDGTFVQKVPLVGITSEYTAHVAFKGRTESLAPNRDIVAVSHLLKSSIDLVDSPMVFVGYGAVAPEYGWDDFKGVDLKGKTAVFLIGDPPVADPKNPSQLDDSMFRGSAMTYYGRWTYKYEIAAEKGAAAAIIVHETKEAAYPFEVVASSWSRENFDIKSTGANGSTVAVQAWFSVERTRSLLKECGLDFDRLKEKAVHKDFKPVPLCSNFTAHVKNKMRDVQSKNLVAKIPGSDPKGRHLIYSAHWDHLGSDPSRAGDPVFHGAIDNASGVGSLLQIAKAFRARKTPPRSTILFLSATAEEKGLLGSMYYAAHPLYPLEKADGIINLDCSLNPWGKTRDIQVIGAGYTSLEDDLRRVATGHGRVLLPESDPEKGMFYRSDQFEFAKKGVPGLFPKPGENLIDQPKTLGRAKHEEYVSHDYHKVTDTVKPGWDLSGALEDLDLIFEAGESVANSDRRPEWKPKTEFHRR